VSGAIAASVGGVMWVAWQNAPASQSSADVGETTVAETVAQEAPAEVEDAPTAPEQVIASTAPEPAEAEASEPPAAEEPEPEVAEPEEVVEAEPEMPAPTLDTFRVEADGQTVLAGRAAPGIALDILVAGDVVERITADASGGFFTFLDLDPSDVSRSLTVVADPEGAAVAMAQTYFIEPFGTEDAETALAEAQTIPGAVTPLTDDEQAESEAAEEAPADEAAAVETAEAVSDEPQSEEAPIEVSDAEDPAQAEATDAPVETADASAAEEDIAGAETELTSTETPSAVAETETAPDANQLDGDSGTADEPIENAAVDVPETTAPPITDEASVVTEAIEDIFGQSLDPAPATDGAEVAQIETETAVAPVDSAVPEVPQTPRVLVADEDGVRLITPSQKPEAQTEVALDTITYDPEGEVILAGRASSDGFVQVYIDNKPITVSRITADLNWQTDLPDVDTGIYTLRIDEVDEEGTVVSRIETPFKREEPEVVATVMAEETAQEDFEVAVKTVQPGSTLWAIAREQYGQGILYVSVFEANRDLIRDPDLIYPGQIFVLPQLEENLSE